MISQSKVGLICWNMPNHLGTYKQFTFGIFLSTNLHMGLSLNECRITLGARGFFPVIGTQGSTGFTSFIKNLIVNFASSSSWWTNYLAWVCFIQCFNKVTGLLKFSLSLVQFFVSFFSVLVWQLMMMNFKQTKIKFKPQIKLNHCMYTDIYLFANNIIVSHLWLHVTEDYISGPLDTLGQFLKLIV